MTYEDLQWPREWLQHEGSIMFVKNRDRTPYDKCTVKGCKQTGASYYMERHRKQKHRACECGWVGIRHGSHVAMMRRQGQDEANHVEVEWV